jgi:hypothetical protein
MRILYIERSPIPGKHQQKTQILTDKKYYINISSLSRPLPASVEPLDVLQKNRKKISRLETPLAKNVGKPRSTQAFTFHVGDSPWYKHAWRW